MDYSLLYGFSSLLLRLPEENFTVVILANTMREAPESNSTHLARELADIYLNDKLAPMLVAKKDVPPKNFDSIVGRYDALGQILTVIREGGHLFAHYSFLKSEIVPISDMEFIWRAADAQLTFVKDKSGNVVKAVFDGQNGHIFVAKKIE